MTGRSTWKERTALATLVFLFIGSLAHASPRELQPKTYESPQGLWSLRVEPLTRDGTGEADYTLIGNGHEAWKARHPFALWDAAVTEDGRVAGYAYVEEKPGSHFTSLHVVLLSPRGAVLLDEVHKRKTALGLFVQPELERFVVRIADEGPDFDGESWWAYDLTTGKPLVQERLQLAAERVFQTLRAWNVRAVPKTPLLLVHWYREDDLSASVGAVFQLLDATRQPVWRLDLPHDYEVEDEYAREHLIEEVESEGAILATDSQGFDLHHVAEGQRVSYEVTTAADGSWTVSEVAREPHRDVEQTKAGSAEPFRPVLSRDVALGSAPPPKGEIRDIVAFGFDAESRLRFVRRDEEGTSLVLLTTSGEVRRVSPVPPDVGGDEVQWFPISAPNWLVVTRDFDDRENGRGWRVDARAWCVNEETGALRELPDFLGQDVQRVVELSGDRILVLSIWDFEFFTASTLSACDGTGETLWAIEEGHDHEDLTKLYSPADVTVTSDGKVVVLDSSRNSLQVFSEQGEYVETVDLAPAWGDELSIWGSMVADRDAGVLIWNSDATPQLWRMGLDGSVRAKFDARTEGGQSRSAYPANIQVAPDGRLWTTDRHEFVGLDEDGMAYLHLGEPVRIEQLESPGDATIDSTFGRILIVDDRTRVVHVFDGEGRPVMLCRPREDEFDAMDSLHHIRCDSKGGVLVGESPYSGDYLRFGSDGASLGPASTKGARATFVPGRDAHWGAVEHELVRFTASDEAEISLSKLADGRWWRRIKDIAVAADGRLAVLDIPDFALESTSGAEVALVALFDREGSPLGLHELPKSIRPDYMAYAGSWVLLAAFGEGAWLLDTRNGRLLPIDLGTQVDPDSWIRWGLEPSGTELWVVQPDAGRLLKFSLPS